VHNALTTSALRHAHTHTPRPQSLPYASQSTCVRLSLNLVECLYTSFKRPDSDMATKNHAQVGPGFWDESRMMWDERCRAIVTVTL
jgi:hypothetical protein